MKKLFPPTLVLFLALLAAQIVLSFGTTLAVYATLLSSFFGYVVLRIFQTAGFLLLLFTLGASIGALQDGKRARAYLFLLSAVTAHFFGAILALFWQALFLRQGISAEQLSLLLGSIMDSSILPLFISLFLVHAVYLRAPMQDTPKGWRDLTSTTVRAAILVSSVIFVYRLIGQIRESIESIEHIGGYIFLKPAEKATLFLDYIPILLASFLGYFVLLFAKKLYCRTMKKAQ